MNRISEIFAYTKVIAVVGLSNNPARPSHGVAAYLQREGFHVIPVNPNEIEVLGERSYASLEEVPVPVDMVDIFRRSEHVAAIVESAIRIGAKCIWMQEGVIDEQSAARARNAGLDVVMDRCTLKEHRKSGLRR